MDDLDAGMSWWEFSALLNGLSPDSMWRRVAASEPVEVTGDAARSAIAAM